MSNLVKYDSARFALQQAVEIDEVKDIRDKAQAMAAYARQANDTQLVEWATEIKVRAERKAGQMLADMPKNPGQLNNSSRSHDATATKTLSELGINKTQSSRWQKLAAVSDDQFEEAIVAAKEVAGEVTTAAMLRIEKSNRPVAVAPVKSVSSQQIPEEQEEPEYDPEEDRLQENADLIEDMEQEILRLKDALACGQLPDDEEISTAAEIITDLRKQVKTLEATLSAVQSSRDGLLVQNAELKKQCASQRNQLKKLGAGGN